MQMLKTAASVAVLVSAAGVGRAQSFAEGFDDITIVLGTDWFTVNNSESPNLSYTGWFQGIDNPRISAHSGVPTSYAAANYPETLGTLGPETLNVWLLTPARLLRNGEVLRFWTRTVTPLATIYPDRIQVRLSTAGTSTNVGAGPTEVGDFTTLLLDINPNYTQILNPGPPSGNPPTVEGFPVDWTQYTLTLGGLPGAGVPGRFAFRYFVENGGINGIYSNVIGVDDLEYVAAPSAPACYINCDASTTLPCLNVLDFGCFLNKFASNDIYANCDNSTTAPVLNVLDFGCFLNRFASGCSSC